MTKERRDRAERLMLRLIADGCEGHPFGCRPPPGPARDRLKRKGLIRHFLADGKAGNPHRWALTEAGREALQ